MGVKTIDAKALDEIGRIASARLVHEEDDLTIMSTNGQMLRTKIGQVKRAGRATRGVRLINLDKGDSVASIAILSIADLKMVEMEEDKSSNGTGT
jgi:DNA gyrase subunit A